MPMRLDSVALKIAPNVPARHRGHRHRGGDRGRERAGEEAEEQVLGQESSERRGEHDPEQREHHVGHGLAR